MGNLHILDLAVVAAYLAIVMLVGYFSRHAARGEESYFLAGRKLGKLYQFFLSFGNATEPHGAVSTASMVFQRGAPGAWFTFQTVFMNPYYWFMNVWFRRVRLVTVADMFEDRLGSRGLSRLYALFQVGVACALLGFGNLVIYKIASSLVLKPETQWTADEAARVTAFAELRALEGQTANGTMPTDREARLTELRDRRVAGELGNTVTALRSLPFYLVFTLVIGVYIILGGMSAAAINEALQSLLIIAFSVLLLPAGIQAVGGWDQLAQKIPSGMFDLFGSESGSPLFVFAVMFTSLVQIQGMSQNMAIYGSARNEFAARFGGVAGNYMKRVMIILWAVAGLIAVALFGPTGLADPDATWGAMSNRLLGPGFAGLMLAGVLAGTMSSFAAKALAVSSLFARNVIRHLRPQMTEAETIRVARWSLVAILISGVVAAECMRDFETVIKLLLTINVPFGAAIMLMFFWRKLTVPAVWVSVLLSIIVIILVPLFASAIPALSRSPSLSQTVSVASGRPLPVYFKEVARERPGDATSPLRGRGRFNFECWLLKHAGLDPIRLSASGRETAQFLFDGLFPFALLFAVSLFTRPPSPEKVSRFFGKMKTPVGETPELDALAVNDTLANPGRFDHTKLFPGSSWEFTRWNREDTLGFVGCCAASAATIGLFVLILRFASNA